MLLASEINTETEESFTAVIMFKLHKYQYRLGRRRCNFGDKRKNDNAFSFSHNCNSMLNKEAQIKIMIKRSGQIFRPPFCYILLWGFVLFA